MIVVKCHKVNVLLESSYVKDRFSVALQQFDQEQIHRLERLLQVRPRSGQATTMSMRRPFYRLAQRELLRLYQPRRSHRFGQVGQQLSASHWACRAGHDKKRSNATTWTRYGHCWPLTCGLLVFRLKCNALTVLRGDSCHVDGELRRGVQIRCGA